MKTLRLFYRHRAAVGFTVCLVLSCGIDGVVDLILSVL